MNGLIPGLQLSSRWRIIIMGLHVSESDKLGIDGDISDILTVQSMPTLNKGWYQLVPLGLAFSRTSMTGASDLAGTFCGMLWISRCSMLGSGWREVHVFVEPSVTTVDLEGGMVGRDRPDDNIWGASTGNICFSSRKLIWTSVKHNNGMYNHVYVAHKNILSWSWWPSELRHLLSGVILGQDMYWAWWVRIPLGAWVVCVPL